MTDKLTTSQKSIEFLYSIGLPPMRILRGLIILLVIGAIAAALYFMNFDSFRSADSENEESDSELVESERPNYEFDLTLDQQINELTFFDPRNRSYVVVYGELQSQIETISELRNRPDITPAQTDKLDRIQLRNLQTLLIETMRTGVSADYEMKAFSDFANQLASGSNEESQDLAKFALARTAVSVFGFKPNEANSKRAIEALNNSQSAFVNSKARAESLLAAFLKTRQDYPNNEYTDNCVTVLGKLFGNSTIDEVRELSKQIGEFSLFAKLDVTTLEDRIRYQDRDALMDLDKALRVVEAHPEIELAKWQLLMHCYEASLSTGRVNDFATGQSIVRDLVSKLPDSDQRKTELLDYLQRQETRSLQIGKPLDITGATLNEKEIQQSTGDYTVLFFLDRSAQSVAMMRELSSSQLERGRTFRPVIAFKDSFSEADIEKVNKIPKWIFVADEATSNKYLKAFPNDFFPYLLLIDENGIVVAGNLSLVQVANRIASMEKERKAAAEPALTQ